MVDKRVESKLSEYVVSIILIIMIVFYFFSSAVNKMHIILNFSKYEEK